MIIFRKAKEVTDFLLKKKKDGSKIGFVPTMGALHQGHLSLIRTCKKENDIAVCSIFVNPTQFNDPSDFQKYPITIENDIYLLETNGCDALFLPSVSEMYPDGLKNNLHYDLGYLETILEGKYRPGHFQGVCQVVNRLLDIVVTNNLYLGQKDYQQCMILKKLVDILQLPVTVTVCATTREADGLAMSSRNMRLDESERKKAVTIFETLDMIKKELHGGSLIYLKEKAEKNLSDKGFKIDYVEIANANTLQSIAEWDQHTPLVALCAAFLDDVRLIDNMLLN